MGFEPGHKKFGGKKKGYKKPYSREAIEEAFENAKVKHNGISLLEHLCELAYEDNDIAIKMLRKLVPDLRSMELKTSELDSEDWAERQAGYMIMMERSTNGSAHLMGQVKDLLCRIKVGMVIDAGFVAEIEKMTEPLEHYINYGFEIFPDTCPPDPNSTAC